MKQSDIQKFIISSLKDNVEFNTLCAAKAGGKLNFYRDSSIRETKEIVPYLVAHKFTKKEMLTNSETSNMFVSQFVVAMAVDEKAIDVAEVKVFPSSDNIEDIVEKAIEIIKCNLRKLGILVDGTPDKNMFITDIDTLITEVGESTTDIQAVVTLRLEDIRTIYKKG
jgi:hypothetical protein